jgi:hypothetical protein
MNSFVQETSVKNNFIYKIIDVSIKGRPIIDNVCWFCSMKCPTFVKICDDCKYENYDKKRKIKKN